MLREWRYSPNGPRDLRIDWLRGLAMTFVIIDHSKLSSLFSWFSYERFWTVTAAEVFVVLSGSVLGMVYGHKLKRGDLKAVVRGLGVRALTLYLAFLAVTLSVVALSIAGVDVRSLTEWNDPVNGLVETLQPQHWDAGAWRDVLLMRSGPWAFQIVCLYVWLVAAAIPALIALRFWGWRPLIAASWFLYLSYRIAPHALTAGQFESTFPLLAWQLLFVHGLALGYHRDGIRDFIARWRITLPLIAGVASAVFIVFALCNPWTAGPGLLQWHLVSPELFTEIYFRYFGLSDLGIGRLLNLAVALPVAYAMLTVCWRLARPFGVILVTLGQRSLGAFVLHVYAILLIAHLPQAAEDGLWMNTLIQLSVILAIAGLLVALKRNKQRPTTVVMPPARTLAA